MASLTKTIAPVGEAKTIFQISPPTFKTGLELRLACRNSTYTTPTVGEAPTYIQANLIVLPSQYASDFRLLCARNPVPCPLLAESLAPGRYDVLRSHIPGVSGTEIAANLDLRRDFPRYIVYRDGVPVKSSCEDAVDDFTADHVAFLIGCSYSFEAELSKHDLTPMHVRLGRNVAMYRTLIPLSPAGVFTGSNMVVSMRPYPKREVQAVRDLTRGYVRTHGEPVDWGWDAVKRLGIFDLSLPEWGDAPLVASGQPLVAGIGKGEEEIVPVFWGCGVTPQEAVARAKLQGTVIGHAPGYMLLLDVRDWNLMEFVGNNS